MLEKLRNEVSNIEDIEDERERAEILLAPVNSVLEYCSTIMMQMKCL